MSKSQQKQQNKAKNDKFFSKDNLAGIIAFGAVILVALYVISTHLNLPVLFVPDDAVSITYPSSILSIPAKEQAKNMKNTEGIYRVKVNSEGGLDIKMSPDRYQKIKDAAKNAVESMTLISIGAETAVQEYKANEDFTVFNVTVNPDIETLEQEISDAVYTIRLYHVCHMNTNATVRLYYIDQNDTAVAYKSEEYDIDGNIKDTMAGAIEYPVIEAPTE